MLRETSYESIFSGSLSVYPLLFPVVKPSQSGRSIKVKYIYPASLFILKDIDFLGESTLKLFGAPIT